MSEPNDELARRHDELERRHREWTEDVKAKSEPIEELMRRREKWFEDWATLRVAARRRNAQIAAAAAKQGGGVASLSLEPHDHAQPAIVTVLGRAGKEEKKDDGLVIVLVVGQEDGRTVHLYLREEELRKLINVERLNNDNV